MSEQSTYTNTSYIKQDDLGLLGARHLGVYYVQDEVNWRVVNS